MSNKKSIGGRTVAHTMRHSRREIKEIHRLLDRTVVKPEAFEQWLIESKETSLSNCLAPLSNYLLHHSPSKLYRLRGISNLDFALDALRSDKFFLSRADLFNDPYDCLLYYDETHLRAQIEQHISRENLAEFFQQADILQEGTAQLNAVLDFFDEKRDEFVYETLSNIAENPLQKSICIASLTEDISSPVMWAHYADDHCGFAIEYQFPGDFFPPHPFFVRGEDINYDWYGWRSLLPVRYSEERADSTQLMDWYCLCERNQQLYPDYLMNNLSHLLPDLLLKTKLSLQKSHTWGYEQEWRLILSQEWPNEAEDTHPHFEFPAAAIYLGTRISDENRSKLLEIAEQKHIPAYQMYIDHSSRRYEVKFKDCTMFTAV